MRSVETQLRDYFSQLVADHPVPNAAALIDLERTAGAESSPGRAGAPVSANGTTPIVQGDSGILVDLVQQPEPKEHTMSPKQWILVGVAAALVVIVGIVAVNAPSDDEGRLDSVDSPEQSADAAPVETTSPSSPPPTTVAPEPRERIGGLLDGGTSYQTHLFDQGLAFAIPEAHGADSWEALAATPQRLILLAVETEQTPDFAENREPALHIAPVSEGSTVDDVIASIMAFATDSDDLELAAETGIVGGEEVAALRGRSSAADRPLEVPTSDSTFFELPPGSESLVYVIEGPTQVVVVSIDSREVDFEWMVERVSPILDSIEFT